jgi:hypothetical protein
VASASTHVDSFEDSASTAVDKFGRVEVGRAASLTGDLAIRDALTGGDGVLWPAEALPLAFPCVALRISAFDLDSDGGEGGGGAIGVGGGVEDRAGRRPRRAVAAALTLCSGAMLGAGGRSPRAPQISMSYGKRFVSWRNGAGWDKCCRRVTGG